MATFSTDALGRRNVIFQEVVSLVQPKGKPEDLNLVLSEHSFVLLKLNGKIHVEFHWLSIKRIESPTNLDLIVYFEKPGEKEKNVTLKCTATDEIIAHINASLALDFPNLPVENCIKFDVQPIERLRCVEIFYPDIDLVNRKIPVGPGGGYLRSYDSACELMGLRTREELKYDIENWLSSSVREFNVDEIDDPDTPKDILPFLFALHYNTYFNKLTSTRKLSTDAGNAIVQLVKVNRHLEEISLSDSGLSKEFFANMGDNLALNGAIPVRRIDLSENPGLDEKGFIALSNFIQKSSQGLTQINFSAIGAPKKAIANFGTALRKNVQICNTLTFLDLSNNPKLLEADGAASIADFLAIPNVIRKLHLANTGLNLDSIFGALLRGCSQNLVSLDLSGNKVTSKKGSSPPPSFEQFFQTCSALRDINLNATKLWPSYVESLLKALSGNILLEDVALRLRDNDLGASPNSGVIFMELLPKVRNVFLIDLSENGFLDDATAKVFKGLRGCSGITSIFFEKNFRGQATKDREKAVIEISLAIRSDICQLQKLSLSGCALRTDIRPVFNALTTNPPLRKLNISGNLIGEKGERSAVALLSKALQTNKTLKVLVWDENLPSYDSYNTFVQGLQKNTTLIDIPFPVFDYNALIGSDKQGPNFIRVRKVFDKIEEILKKNRSPVKGIEDNLGMEGQIMNAQQQEDLERLVLQIKRVQQSLKEQPNNKLTEEANLVLSSAANVISDVEANAELFSKLFYSTQNLWNAHKGKVKERLREMVNIIAPTLENNFQAVVKDSLVAIGNRLNLADQKAVSQLNKALQVGATRVEISEIEKVIFDQIGNEIEHQSVASYASVVSTASNFTFEKLREKLESILVSLQATLEKIERLRNAPEPESKPDVPATTSAPTTASPSVVNIVTLERASTVVPRINLTAGGSHLPKRVSRNIDALLETVEVAPDRKGSVSKGEEKSAPLSHLTKDRPARAGRRPPTKRARPMPGIILDEESVDSTDSAPPPVPKSSTKPMAPLKADRRPSEKKEEVNNRTIQSEPLKKRPGVPTSEPKPLAPTFSKVEETNQVPQNPVTQPALNPFAPDNVTITKEELENIPTSSRKSSMRSESNASDAADLVVPPLPAKSRTTSFDRPKLPRQDAEPVKAATEEKDTIAEKPRPAILPPKRALPNRQSSSPNVTLTPSIEQEISGSPASVSDLSNSESVEETNKLPRAPPKPKRSIPAAPDGNGESVSASMPELNSGAGFSYPAIRPRMVPPARPEKPPLPAGDDSSDSPRSFPGAINIPFEEQKYKDWLNKHLEKSSIKIDDVTGGLKDGIALITLLENVTGQSAPKHQKRAIMPVHRIDNLNIALKFAAQTGLAITGVTAEDIFNEEKKKISILLNSLMKVYP